MPPQIPVNIAGKIGPEKLTVGWPWRFFLFSILMIITFLVVYFGLTLGYRPFLESLIEEQNIEINQLGQTISQQDQQGFINFYSQLANLQNILNSHVTSS